MAQVCSTRANGGCTAGSTALPRPPWPWRCRLSEFCCRPCLSCAAWIIWITRTFMGIEYNCQTLEFRATQICRFCSISVRQQHTCCVDRILWYCLRPSCAPHHHMPSPAQFPTLASCISAGISDPPAVCVTGMAGCALLRHGSSSCTCCRWCLCSRTWNRALHGHRSASERA